VDEGVDSFIDGDVGDGEPHVREALDVVMQRLILVVPDFLQVILGAGLLVSGHEVVNESPSELGP
jgi:glutamate dehydrogenase/leucine dehydrogenase